MAGKAPAAMNLNAVPHRCKYHLKLLMLTNSPHAQWLTLYTILNGTHIQVVQDACYTPTVLHYSPLDSLSSRMALRDETHTIITFVASLLDASLPIPLPEPVLLSSLLHQNRLLFLPRVPPHLGQTLDRAVGL